MARVAGILLGVLLGVVLSTASFSICRWITGYTFEDTSGQYEVGLLLMFASFAVPAALSGLLLWLARGRITRIMLGSLLVTVLFLGSYSVGMWSTQHIIENMSGPCGECPERPIPYEVGFLLIIASFAVPGVLAALAIRSLAQGLHVHR